MAEVSGKIAEALMAGNDEEVAKLTKEGLEGGLSATELLQDHLLVGMDVVGARFKVGEMFIPEVLRSAKAMHAAMAILKPILAESGAKSIGKVVIGTVEGDLHDIGKNLVAMMFEGSGFEVINLGIDIKPLQFVEAVKEHAPGILAMSALLSTTIPKMGETIEALEAAGVREQVKVMIGGAPVTNDYAMKIVADAYTSNAAGAVERGKELLN